MRKVISVAGLTFSSPCPWQPGTTLGEAILHPTKIYVKQLLPVVQAGLIKGMSHITGGGFVENIPRVLPKGTGCYVDVTSWDLPAPFRFLIKYGGVEPLEMARTFNNGIGMVLVVAPGLVDQVIQALNKAGETVYKIGEVTNKSGVEMRGLESWRT